MYSIISLSESLSMTQNSQIVSILNMSTSLNAFQFGKISNIVELQKRQNTQKGKTKALVSNNITLIG
jgi:hypothetical protein